MLYRTIAYCSACSSVYLQTTHQAAGDTVKHCQLNMWGLLPCSSPTGQMFVLHSCRMGARCLRPSLVLCSTALATLCSRSSQLSLGSCHFKQAGAPPTDGPDHPARFRSKERMLRHAGRAPAVRKHLHAYFSRDLQAGGEGLHSTVWYLTCCSCRLFMLVNELQSKLSSHPGSPALFIIII